MSSFLTKFSFSVVTLNMAVMAQALDDANRAEKFAESIRQAFSKNLSVEIILISVTSIIVLVIAVVLYEIRRSSKLRQEIMDLAWIKFDYHAGVMKLSRDNIAILKNIAQIAGLQDPNSMIKSPSVFESSLEKFYESEKIEYMPDERLEVIRNLRRALGFLPLFRETAYTSTRQFDSGERCIVQVPDSGVATNKGMCPILTTGERHWSIVRPEGPSVPEGTWARMNLTRPGDAEYTFRAQVLRDSGGQLVLKHTNKLNRAQQRNWVRIDVSIPVEVTQMENDHVGDVFAGKIIDMSGGGFGMSLPIRLMNGSKLKLNFELPGQGPINNLLVKIVRVADRNIHSVAFEGNVHAVQEQIIQYIFEKQRQDSSKVNR